MNKMEMKIDTNQFAKDIVIFVAEESNNMSLGRIIRKYVYDNIDVLIDDNVDKSNSLPLNE